MILDLNIPSEDIACMAAHIQRNTDRIVYCTDHNTSIHVVTADEWRGMWIGQNIQVSEASCVNACTKFWMCHSDTHAHVRVFDVRAVQAITTM